MQSILNEIAEQHSLSLKSFTPLSGGDINAVFLVTTDSKQYVIKLNNANKFPGMFQTEAKGLNLLRASNSFQIPTIQSEGTLDQTSYLILEYIPATTPKKRFWEVFASCLAQLHQKTQPIFGLDHDNYIGSLRQYNCPETSAADYYINQRLIPQFRMARDNGYLFENLDVFYSNVLKMIPNEPPSLVHGDLWNGNYIAASNGSPTLIDPAVSFAPREMDLAMMQLFGGFPQEVFRYYNEFFPLEKSWEQRIPLYQLYYNLVHLNLFGVGYLSKVQHTIKLYS